MRMRDGRMEPGEGGRSVYVVHILDLVLLTNILQCYMAPHEGDDDPEVYKSSNGKSKVASSKPNTETPNKQTDPKGKGKAKAQPEDEDMSEGGDDEDEDGTLLTVQPGFNRLLIALRDEGVMKFVKYVSAAAPGSRWDISGEWEVGMLQVDDEGEDDQ